MDKDHANSIAISRILDKLNIRPEHTGKTRALYRSPLSCEKSASFWVYFRDNEWYDYGVSAGGKLTDLAECYLKYTGESHTIIDVLRWIKNMSEDAYAYPQILAETFKTDKDDPVLTIRSIDQIRFIGLIRYLERRGIPLLLAQHYVKEMKLFNKNTGRTFLALAIRNENGGYELNNPFFSGCIQPRTITFIRGSKPESQGVHVFKDVFDYISVLSQLGYKTWEHDTILLNAMSCSQLAAPYIQNYNYKTMHSWMDNDPAGHRATNILNSFVKNQPSLVHLKMNRVYEGFSSVNEWHMRKSGLAL